MALRRKDIRNSRSQTALSLTASLVLKVRTWFIHRQSNAGRYYTRAGRPFEEMIGFARPRRTRASVAGRKKAPATAVRGTRYLFFLLSLSVILACYFTGARPDCLWLECLWLFPFLFSRPLCRPCYDLTCASSWWTAKFELTRPCWPQLRATIHKPSIVKHRPPGPVFLNLSRRSLCH